MDDARTLWLRATVALALEVDGGEFNALMDRKEGERPSQLHLITDFLNTSPKGSCLLFYREPVGDGDDASDVLSQRIHVVMNAVPDIANGGRAMFVLKNVDGRVAAKSDESKTTDELMAAAVEFGILSGHALMMLERILCDLYLPMVDPDGMQQAPAAEHLGGGGLKSPTAPSVAMSRGGVSTSASGGHHGLTMAEEVSETVRNEFSSNMSKFVSQISHAIRQVTGNVHLPVPDVHIDPNNLRAAAENPSIVGQLEHALEEWIQLISNVMDAENRKKAQVELGPVSEINFWRDRNAALSALYEQLNMEYVKDMIKVVELAQVNALPDFKVHLQDLMKLYIEAKDNVKFLTTLERHFKSISRGSLTVIAETIPSMMNSLRMVWIISRHYNKDARMFPLMSLIAKEIADKVAKEISIRTIFRRDPEQKTDEVMRTIKKGREVLELWHDSYMQMREKIEQSGTDLRWEFNRNKLFDQTTYMSRICQDLYNVAETLHQFKKFLGKQLREVTGDTHGIDEATERVKGLVTPLIRLPFNIFDRRYNTSWDQVMKKLHEDVEEIEERTKEFIDSSFQKLRSAEGAFDLLQNFKNIESRESIRQLMMEKFTDILIQYSREVQDVRELFEAGKASPPVSKNQPPIAGAIAWGRSLYHRIKKSVLRFRTMDGLLSSEQGKTVCKEYVAVARMLTNYEARLLADWSSRVTEIVNKKLKEFILREVGDENGGDAAAQENVNPVRNGGGGASQLPTHPRSSSIAQDAGSDESGRFSRASSIGGASRVSRSSRGDGDEAAPRTTHAQRRRRCVVNFSPELHDLIRETRYLDRMGLPIPTVALDVALQERKYYNLFEQLNAMLTAHGEATENLTTTERQLLARRIDELDRVLQPGLDPLNWNSLSIPDFIETCRRSIVQFEATATHVKKNALIIQKTVSQIRSARLVDIASFQERSSVLTLEALVDRVDKLRMTVVEELVRKYKSIGPQLIIIEQHVCEMETGASEEMRAYYAYWERRIFNALTTAIVRGMVDMQQILTTLQPQGHVSKWGQVRKSFFPLIKVVAEMNPPAITVTPNIQDIYKHLSKLIKNIPESAKQFVRWMDGQCLPCAPIVVKDDEEVVYTFYNDLSKNPLVVKMMLTVTQTVQKTTLVAGQYIESWGQYNTKYKLWNSKKMSALERLRNKHRSTAYFDTKLAKYRRLAKKLSLLPHERDIDFVRIDCLPLIVAIQNKAEEWCTRYGGILREYAVQELHAVNDKIDILGRALERNTTGIKELKFVLNTISDILGFSMDMELTFRQVDEKFRTLRMYNIEIDEGDATMADGLPAKWAALVHLCKKRDDTLGHAKQRFTEFTRDLVKKYSAKVHLMKEQFDAEGPGAVDIELDAGLEMMETYRTSLAAFRKERDQLALSEKLFDLPATSFTHLYAVEADMEQLTILYDLYAKQQDAVRKWSSMLWTELEVGTLTRGTQAFLKTLKKMDVTLMELTVYKKVFEAVTAFKDSIPLIASLKNEALRPRHWKQLMQKTGVDFEMDAKTFTLTKLFSMELHRFKEEIAEIVNTATNEAKIEKEIAKISSLWSATSFGVVAYDGDESRGYLLEDCSPVLTDLEDNALNLQAMSNSPFAGSFMHELRMWEKNLNHIAECIGVWMNVQRKWMYLEGIFIGSDDIRIQLPQAAQKFDRVDTQFKKIMSITQKNPNCLSACNSDQRLDDLRALSSELDKCQKSLSDYLDRKRNAFPRFFFISDDELLSVLGSSQANCVQVHMLKLFAAAKALHFVRNESAVAGMSAPQDEKFEFVTQVTTDGAVETWMTNVESEMQRTLHLIYKEAVFHYASTKRIDWINQNLGMVTIGGSQMWWTWEVEDVFRRVRKGDKHAMKELATKLTGQLDELVTAIRDPKLLEANRKKLNTLIIIDVHARDIIDRFVRDSILDAREFDWESQLRFYWDRELDSMLIQQCTGSFSFGYEYLGLGGRLVITPLTDRCYMTLTQALTFHLGGSPAGPAGTGKTETVKDLAKALGLICFVTNCGEGLDYRAMGSIFSGLAQTGAWGCFDEFNRINVEVLSVVSSQLQAIQSALNLNKKRFEFVGKEIRLRPSVGFFVTMNPGYAGRTELPDNLKALFRPVTMIVPDMLQICEIMLFSEGFTGARFLAKKMTVLYHLAKEQLSKQYHYDFGLRALKSVLIMAGALKRESPMFSEDLVLMRALRDMNLPKFVFEDVPLFLGLVSDLFPGMECPRVLHKALKNAIVEELDKEGYHHRDEAKFLLQVDKTVQLYETMLTRHTTMVVGPTGGGKSVVIQTLARAQLKAFRVNTKLFTLNPKALLVSDLYGVLDPVTRDWTDGLLSKMFRELNEPLKAEQREARYIVFDGDVDALWVENMNSVMDDNKLLTLPNGERIRMEDHCKMLFEVDDLQYASPATVSRCGMVYVDPKNLGYKPFFNRWVMQRGDDAKLQALLFSLFDKYVDASIDFVQKGREDGHVTAAGPLVSIIPIADIAMVRQLASLFTALVPPVDKTAAPTLVAAVDADADNKDGKKKDADVDEAEVSAWDAEIVESVFVFCLVWSIGGALVEESRERFDAFVKAISNRPVVASASKTHLPEGLLYDYAFPQEDARWVRWTAAEYVPPVPFEFSRILVPTADTQRYRYLLDQMVRIRKPVMFVGESGTAKTVTLANYLNELDESKNATLTMNFSSRTTSMDVQTIIEDNVEKRTGYIYGPVPGKKLLVFIDDLNMPIVDIYGTQQPIALLKFLVERGHMYDRSADDSKGDRLARKTYRDISYCAAMAPPGGGRNPVDPRFVALFSVFSICFPNEEALQLIYSSMLSGHVAPFIDSVKAVAAKLTPLTIRLYRELIKVLPATPSKFHYVFNLRDISRVYEGLLLSHPRVFDSGALFVRLWRNECLRVFHDRLITADDQAVVKTKLLDAYIKETFPTEAAVVSAEPCVFGDFRNATSETDQTRLYEDLEDYDGVRRVMQEVLNNYNEDQEKPMNLVLFQDALEHLTRIHRILRLPRGNALLVGVGGSGKQSLTKLAAYAAQYSVFQIRLSRSYGEMDFREDLKSLYNILGAENGGSPVVFLFTDSHVKDEGFLELINNMLASGMVPALFNDDERAPLIESVRAEVRERGLAETRENCWNFFVNKCRDNLHIVLAMSPVGDTLRRRCRNFPGLVNNTVIDWYFPWPRSALEAVATHLLAAQELPQHLVKDIGMHMVNVHLSVGDFSRRFMVELRRPNHVTPKTYLDYIQAYATQLTLARATNRQQYSRLDGGLQKLVDAGEQVEAFGEELTERKAVVDEKRHDCNGMIEQIRTRQEEVSHKQKDAATREAKLTEDNARIVYEKREAEKALIEAEPALEAAAQALKNLRKEAVSEVRVMPTPPMAVLAVMQCVLELKPTGLEDPSLGWRSAKVMMSDPNFLAKLRQYPKDTITDKMISKVNKILRRKPQDPKQRLTLENLKRISTAACGLFQWVVAIVNYNKVAKAVAPRRAKVKRMERELTQSVDDLKNIKDTLAQLESEIHVLQQTYTEKSDELADLEEKAQQMEKHLLAAQQLIDGLGSERTRWTIERDRLAEAETRLVGDCLLAAGFLSYTGAFTYEYRQAMILDTWQPDLRKKRIPLTTPFSLTGLLTSEVEVSRWVGEGLPGDDLSVQNGILTSRASRWPLCIDPQMQASKWIRRKEASSKDLKIRTLNDGDFMRLIEIAIQFGNPFILENVGEELDPVIDPVLEKNFVVSGNSKAIVIGENTIDWDDNFRFYMISKLGNPNYTPEVAAKTMIINFTVTAQGLEDQLLNVVIGNERADLQKQREELIQTISRSNITLVELEDNILKELTESHGNILDNVGLIATLKEAKTKSVLIAESLVESKITAEEIEKVTDIYRSAAKRGATLFFSMVGLASISPMYEFSLESYLDVFVRGLQNSKKDAVVAARVANIIAALTRDIYDYTCTGIFEKHKLMYSMQMTTMILDGDGKLNRGELDFFLKGNLELSAKLTTKPAEWIPDATWKDLHALKNIVTRDSAAEVAEADAAAAAVVSVVDDSEEKGDDEAATADDGEDGEKKSDDEANGAPKDEAAAAPSAPVTQTKSKFHTILDDVRGNLDEWRDWYALEKPESVDLPCGLSERLDTFQQLLLIRSFRPDRCLTAIRNFIVHALDSDYFVQPPVLKYDRIYAQSSPNFPVVFILSPGADPQNNLVELAKQQDMFPQKFKYLALGQGQAKVAERVLELGYYRGHWVVLQNCHLLTSWLKTLEKMLAGFTKPHENFRLWLTTDPTPEFPIGILQRALKVVTEPPDGLKLNMKSSWSRINAEELETVCPHKAYKPLVYVLSFFHAVVQERRKYGKLGWNVFYDFNDSDFNVSRRLLGMYLTKAHNNGDENIPWTSLRYLIGEAMYGGRVTDSFDRRILITYLEEYMGDFLFDDCQPFAFARTNFDYIIPQLGDKSAYTDMIEKLPLENSPIVYGLHSNAEIRYNTDSVKAIWNALIDLQPRSSGVDGGVSRETYITQVAADVLSKVPEPFDLAVIRSAALKRSAKEVKDQAKKVKERGGGGGDDEKAPIVRKHVAGELPPTTVVLLQELERWNKLVEKLATSLDELSKALRGEVGMSNDLDELATALFNGTLPAMWRRLAPQTEKRLGAWMTHFARRHSQYSEWVREGQDPKVMWLSGLHVPESYLTALVQTTCRRKGWPLDKSTLYTKVTSMTSAEEVKQRPIDGCYVTGLFLEGAAWDHVESCLVNQAPKILTTELPILQVMPIEANKLKLQNTYKTPVYTTQARRNAMGIGLVFEADLTTSAHASHWSLQGCAAVLNTDH
jgi:dynein heavy chain